MTTQHIRRDKLGYSSIPRFQISTIGSAIRSIESTCTWKILERLSQSAVAWFSLLDAYWTYIITGLRGAPLEPNQTPKGSQARFGRGPRLALLVQTRYDKAVLSVPMAHHWFSRLVRKPQAPEACLPRLGYWLGTVGERDPCPGPVVPTLALWVGFSYLHAEG